MSQVNRSRAWFAAVKHNLSFFVDQFPQGESDVAFYVATRNIR